MVCTWIRDKPAVLACRPKISPQVGVAWGTCPISKFRDSLNISVSDEATLFKFCVHVDPGLLLPADQKLAQEGVAWGTCPILKFWDPLNISVSDEATVFKFGVHMDPGLFLPADLKLAPSGRGLGYVPNFEISGPPQYLCIG